MSFSEGTEQQSLAVGPLLLEDVRLMHRIDAFAHGEYDTDDPLDACPSCGAIQPGYRYCRHCLERIPRKRGIDDGFWIQEVAGEGQHQDAFQRIVAGVPDEAEGGVHVWVASVLLPDQAGEGSVRVSVLSERPAEQVGFIVEADAPGLRKACIQVSKTLGRAVACRGLINGGFVLDDGTTATYGISLLLPAVSRFMRLATQAVLREQESAAG